MKRGSHRAATAAGQHAEQIAAAHLALLGMQVLARNVRGAGGEIDIVAREGDTIVFVEVKARSSAAFGSALAAVDARKRRRIRAIAADYLQVVAPQSRARFDVLTIEPAGITLHRNAFA